MVQQFTTNIKLEELLEGQDRSDLTANFTFRHLDMILYAFAVDKRNDPPSSPTAYVTLHIVGSAPTGAWANFAEDNMAYWDGIAWKEILVAKGYGTISYNATLGSGTTRGGTGQLDLHQVSWVSKWGTVSATTSEYGCAPSIPVYIDKVTLISSLATTSDGGNNWTFQLHNRTATLTLFATAPTTNGSEFVVDTAKVLTPDQNTLITAGEVLELVATLTGTPGNLGQFHVQIDGHYIY